MPPKKVLKPDKGQQSLFSFGLGRQATAASESDDAPVEGEPDTGTGSAELETETESGEAGSSEQNVGKSRRRFVPAWANMPMCHVLRDFLLQCQYYQQQQQNKLQFC